MSFRETDEIRGVITAAERAMRERDAAGLIGRYSEDVVKFDLAPPLGRSGDDARDVGRQQAWFDTFEGPVDFEVTELSIHVHGEFGWAHSLNRMSASPKGAGFAFEMWFRATYGLRKVDGRWLIAHEHSSTPFYMDGSLRAATDLKP
ncbi:YybH family protein [Kutzneria sp. NPDC052558]|uniref:YybH family protein n=1 Tax=Kutzneria sp. NPDC052558 TaxID=3364121 RepID=UPI0037C7A37E